METKTEVEFKDSHANRIGPSGHSHVQPRIDTVTVLSYCRVSLQRV